MRLKIKLKDLHFNTIEVIVTIKNWQKRWERCIRAEGDYFEGNGSQLAQS
jgi:hypothetical protein